MTVHRGDIVLLNFPFSSGAGAKVRPALVVQTDLNNRRLGSTIVAMITSRQSGLLHDSAIKCENLFTVELTVLRRIIGSLPIDAMIEVDRCLMTSLGMK